MKQIILNEIESIRGHSSIFSLNKVQDAADAEPAKYPFIFSLFRERGRTHARKTISAVIRDSGNYTRWNSELGSQRGSAAVWQVKP